MRWIAKHLFSRGASGATLLRWVNCSTPKSVHALFPAALSGNSSDPLPQSTQLSTPPFSPTSSPNGLPPCEPRTPSLLSSLSPPNASSQCPSNDPSNPHYYPHVALQIRHVSHERPSSFRPSPRQSRRTTQHDRQQRSTEQFGQDGELQPRAIGEHQSSGEQGREGESCEGEE